MGRNTYLTIYTVENKILFQIHEIAFRSVQTTFAGQS